jgi:hypothetical protein
MQLDTNMTDLWAVREPPLLISLIVPTQLHNS